MTAMKRLYEAAKLIPAYFNLVVQNYNYVIFIVPFSFKLGIFVSAICAWVLGLGGAIPIAIGGLSAIAFEVVSFFVFSKITKDNSEIDDPLTSFILLQYSSGHGEISEFDLYIVWSTRLVIYLMITLGVALGWNILSLLGLILFLAVSVHLSGR